MNAPEPLLERYARLDAKRVVELKKAIVAAGGDEVLVRTYDDNAVAGPSATRLRKLLGIDFYVRRRDGNLYAPVRREDEPPVKLRRMRLGKQWMTKYQAAERLGITEQWLRREYIRKGAIEAFTFGGRVVLRTADIEKIAAEREEQKRWLLPGDRGGNRATPEYAEIPEAELPDDDEMAALLHEVEGGL